MSPLCDARLADRSGAGLYLALASVNSVPLWSNAGESTTEAQRTRSEWLGLAREKLAEAKRLVEQTEKPYRPHVPDWDDWEPQEYVGVFKKIVGYHCRNAEIDILERALS